MRPRAAPRLAQRSVRICTDTHTGGSSHTLSVASDLRKAKQMRADAKTVQDPDAKESFIQAAARLEKRAAKGAKRIGRITRKKTVTPVLGR